MSTNTPSMRDALAAGDGTLHGAIDYWQRRALEAEARLSAAPQVPQQEQAAAQTDLQDALQKFASRFGSAPQPSDGWISVNDERLPDDSGSYIIANQPLQMVAPLVGGVIRNNVGTKWDWDFGVPITHWQPIPAAPAAQGDEPFTTPGAKA